MNKFNEKEIVKGNLSVSSNLPHSRKQIFGIRTIINTSRRVMHVFTLNIIMYVLLTQLTNVIYNVYMHI